MTNNMINHSRNLKCPTLLIRGRLSDLVTPAEAKQFFKDVPHALYVRMIPALVDVCSAVWLECSSQGSVVDV